MKLCLDCTEYSCGAQGSYNISQTCGDNGTYFYRTEKENKRTMKKENIFDDHTILDDILDEIDQLRNALMLGEFPPDVAYQYKNTAYGLDYAECIIMKYKKAMREKED